MSLNNNCPWIRNDKQPNIRHASGGPLYRWSFASAAGFPDQEARWLYEIQPEVEKKFNLWLKLQASSFKLDNGSGISTKVEANPILTRSVLLGTKSYCTSVLIPDPTPC